MIATACSAPRCCRRANAEDRSAIGAVILRGAKQTGPNKWTGKLFNVEDGKTYDGFITIVQPDAADAERVPLGHAVQRRDLDARLRTAGASCDGRRAAAQ